MRSSLKPRLRLDKLSGCLNKLQQEDPTFECNIDPETNQTIISGMGELHLEVLVDRMRREFSLDVNVSKPQVAYRETITNLLKKLVNMSSRRVVRGNLPMW